MVNKYQELYFEYRAAEVRVRKAHDALSVTELNESPSPEEKLQLISQQQRELYASKRASENALTKIIYCLARGWVKTLAFRRSL
jgi:hypothetical protein